jgi:hypothetical protein
MAQQILSTNTFCEAKWVVSSDATQGTHTTIAGAIASASSGDTIVLRPGTYTENYTAKAGVSLTAWVDDDEEPNVTIIGKCTFTTAGSFSIANIKLQTNSDFFLSVTGTVSSVVNLDNCTLNCTNNTGISQTSSGGGEIRILNCNSDISTTGIALFVKSGTGNLQIRAGRHTNSGSSSTTNSISSGVLTIEYCDFLSPITTTGTAACSLTYVNMDTAVTNTTTLTAGGSLLHAILFSRLVSGSASAISISTSNFIAYQSSINSTNTNAITGAGTITYSGLTYENTSSLINTTTVNRQVLDGGEYKGRNTSTAPSLGMIGQQIVASVAFGAKQALVSATPKSLTNITLTPGIWDISVIGAFNGAAVATQTVADIGITNNVLTGVAGDSQVSTPTSSNSSSDNMISIPAFRVTVAISTTTIYYLTVQSTFAGTQNAYGRISAVRVA